VLLQHGKQSVLQAMDHASQSETKKSISSYDDAQFIILISPIKKPT